MNNMLVKALFGALIILFCQYGAAQTSQLVFPGNDGRLTYTLYANHGQSEQWNKIPDFSHCGYRGGGVALPDVPVVLILEPSSGDRQADIQNAIEQVSALTPDANGFRGAILLESGQYELGGPLYIQKSGIVLTGAGQDLPENGGTELIATAGYQHRFIQLTGDEQTLAGMLDTELDVQNYPGLNEWMTFDVTSGVIQDHAGDQHISFHLTSDQNLMTYFASREDTITENHPFLEIGYENAQGRDTTLVLPPSDDTYVRGGDGADSNFGDQTEIILKYRPQTLRVHREGFMKFDLSALPEEANIQHAALHLYTVNQDQSEGITVEVMVTHFGYDNWDENVLTWNLYQSHHFGPAYAEQLITTDYVPTGSVQIEVEDASVFTAGDTVHVIRTPNQHWIDTIDMTRYDWTPDGYMVKYERIITAIEDNRLTLDAPMVQAIEKTFGGGKVHKVSPDGRINQCGIQNMVLTSHYQNDTDEQHGWTAVYLHDTENCWVRNVTARYFGYACVELSWANRTTVESCAMLDPVSLTDGGRKYSFYIDKGSFNLFQRCYTRGGRHDYITGSRVAGPNVFVDCAATRPLNDIGPHHRYATGILFDNIYGDEMRVWNRGSYGSGHGWAGAQTMFWNCQSNAENIRIDSPHGGMNWGIGCKGTLQLGEGYWESWGEHIMPRSLYYQQLADRLGASAVTAVTIPEQSEAEGISDLLLNWAGLGATGNGADVNSPETAKPLRTRLSCNYPNPFNPVTQFTLHIARSGQYQLAVYNTYGQQVVSLFNGKLLQGKHEIKIDGASLVSGIYFVRLTGPHTYQTRKMTLIK